MGPRRAKPGPAGSAAPGTLVAEGDSWFDFPGNDILEALERNHGYEVESVAHAGDTVESMAYDTKQYDRLAKCIVKLAERGITPQAILLLGGGNDIAGDALAGLLNHSRAPSKGLNDKVTAGVFDERLFEAYVTLVSAVTELCIRSFGDRVPILLHGYDYPVPDGRGFWGGYWFLPGPWLEPSLRQKGYDPMGEGRRMLKTLIDHFNTMLKRVAESSGFSHVSFVDLRSALPVAGSHTDWWADELHPTSKGFALLAAEIARHIP